MYLLSVTILFSIQLPKDKSMFELLELLMTETNKFEEQIKVRTRKCYQVFP